MKTTRQLKKSLWRVFSSYIRSRDAPNGFGICISCSRRVAYPNSDGTWQAGHYYARSTIWNALYFDEENVNGQCVYCNMYLQGNAQGYAEGLVRKYGRGVIDRLSLRKKNKTKWSVPIYEVMIAEYKKKLKLLTKGKK